MRKISTKILTYDEKNRKNQLKTSPNQYYLQKPQVKAIKTPTKDNKDSEIDQEKEKHHVKHPRKCSHNPQITIHLQNHQKDGQNQSRECEMPANSKNNGVRKVEMRRVRSTSNLQTPKKSVSKSALKQQLGSVRKDPIKRINMKIQAPTIKKGMEKIEQLKDMNFDSYYNEGHMGESKTIRTGKLLTPNRSHSSNSDFTSIFNRCKKLIEDYEEQLQTVKKENFNLLQENKQLKSMKEILHKIDQ